MSRLLIIFLFSLSFLLCFGQNQTKSILKVADEECKKGNYFYAIELYDDLFSKDTANVDLIWKIAEAHRLSKNYVEAEKRYRKLIELDKDKNFESFNLMFGLTLKSEGKYEEAIDYFKTTKKDFTKDRKSDEYQKAKHEIESCLWAKEATKDSKDLTVEPFPLPINSTNAEFAAINFKDEIYFSSIQAINQSDYKSSIYKFSNGLIPFLTDTNRIIDFANGSFSLDGKRFYYSNCKDNKCVIMVSKNINGKWLKGDSLGVIINEENSNTTMPAIGKINNEEVLFFCSDREKSKGKLDIWYSSIKNGNQYSKAKNINSINSIENEVSPWYDTLENKLYFASTWNENLGGFDIFESTYTTQFEAPKNIGVPINSSYNDLYFSKIADTVYFTSNRIGSLSETFPTCCNDLFKAHPPKLIEEKDTIINPIIMVQEESLAELNKRLPIKLYFHNDIPNPRSIDTTTKVNYINSYSDYLQMIGKYEVEYSKGLTGDDAEIAKEDIADFFTEYVIQGVKNLELFRKQLLIELEKGAQINLQIKGFASPLAKSNYNTNLTKRRIYSLINYLSEYDNGIFLPYINGTAENGGHLNFEEIPFGEDNANKLTSDNPNDTKNSIYSRAAALERKIEIRSVTTTSEIVKIDEPKLEEPFSLATNNPLFQFNIIPQNSIVKAQFTIKNTSDKIIEIETIEIPCDCNTVEMQKTIQPNDEITVEVSFNSYGYEGKEIIKSVYLKAKNQSEKLRLVIAGKVQ